MITLFTWNESFLTNLPSVDTQHERLVGLINNLGELVISSKVINPKEFEPMLEAVLDYAKVHFYDEESEMKKLGLDSRHLDRHLAEHRSFLNEAIRLSKIGDDITLEQARSLADYLIRWLAYHILDVDQSMARQVRAIQEGLSPEQAYENETQSRASSTDPLLKAMTGLFYVVSERNRELRIINNELEQRVQQRTVELEKANRQLELLSTHDDLTGLPNRRFANQALNQNWFESQRYGGSLSILMLDADHFKQVNDHYGHAEGDTLLQVLATRLRDAVRRCDIVCRLGGDEFLVICPQTTLAGAADVARKILAASEPIYTANGIECWDGALSIGIAEKLETMTDCENLLKAADQTLYKAKTQAGASMAEHETD